MFGLIDLIKSASSVIKWNTDFDVDLIISMSSIVNSHSHASKCRLTGFDLAVRRQVIDKSLKSGVVYKISCPRCPSCYVGQTSRHLITRMKEHNGKSKPVRRHFEACECEFTMDDVEIIKSTSKSVYHLMTLEALLIRSIKPIINTRNEYKRITLSLKI